MYARRTQPRPTSQRLRERRTARTSTTRARRRHTRLRTCVRSRRIIIQRLQQLQPPPHPARVLLSSLSLDPHTPSPPLPLRRRTTRRRRRSWRWSNRCRCNTRPSLDHCSAKACNAFVRSSRPPASFAHSNEHDISLSCSAIDASQMRIACRGVLVGPGAELNNEGPLMSAIR